MNDIIHPDSKSDVPWPNSDSRMRVPDTSMLPGSEKAPPAAVWLLNSAAQGTHAAIDRLVDRAAPAVRQLGDSVSAAEDALHVKADQLLETRDEWAEGVRTSVRSSPLAAVAAAFVLGAVISRMTR